MRAKSRERISLGACESHPMHASSMQALQSMGYNGSGPGGSGTNATTLQAAVHILQQAGLGLGSLQGLGGGPGGGGPAFPFVGTSGGAYAGAGSGGALNVAAAAHILQQAGLGGMQGLAGLSSGPSGNMNPMMHANMGRMGPMGGMGGNGPMRGGPGGSSMGMGGMGDFGSMGPNGRNGGRLSRRTTDPSAEVERKMQQVRLFLHGVRDASCIGSYWRIQRTALFCRLFLSLFEFKTRYLISFCTHECPHHQS